MRPGELLCLLTALLGVVLITRPSFLFGAHVGQLSPNSVAIALLGAVCTGAAYATVRKMGSLEHPAVIVFYLPLVTFPIAIPFASANWLMPTGWEWLLLLGVGMSTQLAQTSMTRGLQAETAVRATTAGYLQLIFAGIWGALLLGERPSVWTLAGAAVIVSSALVLAFGKRRAEIGDE